MPAPLTHVGDCDNLRQILECGCSGLLRIDNGRLVHTRNFSCIFGGVKHGLSFRFRAVCLLHIMQDFLAFSSQRHRLYSFGGRPRRGLSGVASAPLSSASLPTPSSAFASADCSTSARSSAVWASVGLGCAITAGKPAGCRFTPWPARNQCMPTPFSSPASDCGTSLM